MLCTLLFDCKSYCYKLFIKLLLMVKLIKVTMAIHNNIYMYGIIYRKSGNLAKISLS